MNRFRSELKKILYTLSAVLLVLAAAEGLSRLIWSETDLHMNPELHFFIDHPTLFWVQKPNLDTTFRGGYHLKTNSLGLRNPEIALPKPEGVYRVLSLGESTTWGDRVESEQTYSKVLETMLNQSNGRDGSIRFEVITAGVGGYTLWQSYVYLKEQGLALDPQMVMIYHQTNDFLPSGIIDQHNFLYKVKYTDRELYERRKEIKGLLSLLYHSRAYLAMRKLVLLLPSRLPRISPHYQAKKVRVPDPDRLTALKQMAKLCSERKIQFVIIQPFYQFFRGDDTLLMDFAVARRIPYINLPGLLNDPLGSSVPLFYDDAVHPTVEGHRRIAEAIFQQIQELLTK